MEFKPFDVLPGFVNNDFIYAEHKVKEQVCDYGDNKMFYQSSSTSPGNSGSTSPTTAFHLALAELDSSNVNLDNLPRNVCPPKCEVCDDKATGYHYEVASCNGCKTFFRRNVMMEKKYECLRDGTCFDNPPKGRRARCKACRFNKCVTVGMNPLAIQMSHTNDVINKNVEVICKTQKRRNELEEPSTSREVKLIPAAVFGDMQMERMIDQLLYLEMKTENFRKSRYNPNSFEIKLDDLINSHSILSIADKLGPMPDWPLPQLQPPRDKKEGHEFFKKLHMHNPTRKDWMVFDMITAIEYTKTFPFYHQLKHYDRLILLRGVIVNCFHISQSFYSYINKCESNILHPDGTTVFIPPPDAPFNVLFKFKKNSIGVMFREGITQTEYVLIKNIMICNPALTGLSEEGVNILKEEREKVSKHLLTFCFRQYGASGPSRYATVISLIDFFEHGTKLQKDLHFVSHMIREKDKFPKKPLIDELMN